MADAPSAERHRAKRGRSEEPHPVALPREPESRLEDAERAEQAGTSRAARTRPTSYLPNPVGSTSPIDLDIFAMFRTAATPTPRVQQTAMMPDMPDFDLPDMSDLSLHDQVGVDKALDAGVLSSSQESTPTEERVMSWQDALVDDDADPSESFMCDRDTSPLTVFRLCTAAQRCQHRGEAYT
jgi:hypothetical protein